MIALAQKPRDQMTIGEVAAAMGIAATTLRYYEREGILAPTCRTRKGYRLYDVEAVRRLEFIRSAQASGFTLDDIRALLQLDANTSCREVRGMIERRLADVDTKLVDLNRVRTALADALDRCRRSKQGCAVLGDLRAHSKNRSNK